MLFPLAPSLASQLPQVSRVFTRLVHDMEPCGSWLASDEASPIGRNFRSSRAQRNERIRLRRLRHYLRTGRQQLPGYIIPGQMKQPFTGCCVQWL